MARIIPLDVVENVISCLHDDRRALVKCSRVARDWVPTSRVHLFRKIRFPFVSCAVPYTNYPYDERLRAKHLCELIQGKGCTFRSCVRIVEIVGCHHLGGGLYETGVDSAHGQLVQPWLLRVLSSINRLEFVTTFSLVSFPLWSTMGHDIRHLSPRITSLSAVRIVQCYHATVTSLSSFLSAFPSMRSLTVLRTHIMCPNGPADGQHSMPSTIEAVDFDVAFNLTVLLADTFPRCNRIVVDDAYEGYGGVRDVQGVLTCSESVEYLTLNVWFDLLGGWSCFSFFAIGLNCAVLRTKVV